MVSWYELYPAGKINYLSVTTADESLQEAKILAQASLWRGAFNLSYYAMFYATLALTVQSQQVISKHSGVIAFFDKDFIRTGIFPKELSRHLHFAFERRHNSDYGELFPTDSVETMQFIEDATKFVEKVKTYLRGS